MHKGYKPSLGGFSDKLGLKNGIEELILRPVPKQEVMYYGQDDINRPTTRKRAGKFDYRRQMKYTKR